ncbi:hypothetical protein TNCV_4072631 [Trichonephila clavipes]|uniref:Uncharacterized protein n=1 Tax=Trichonephila clavipes TaxID=2585209 RepID=A0A8X6W878_TRICX|nr:hypothetical protein TNCV_4072631 [Trichonephila clavipes]
MRGLSDTHVRLGFTWNEVKQPGVDTSNYRFEKIATLDVSGKWNAKRSSTPYLDCRCGLKWMGLSDKEAHFWLNGYVNKQSCRIWSEANPQVYVETPLHPEKLTVRCALWAGGILLQKR